MKTLRLCQRARCAFQHAPPPPPDDDQPDGSIMVTTLQPEIQDGHGTFIACIDHATRPFMVTFTTDMILLHLSPRTGSDVSS